MKMNNENDEKHEARESPVQDELDRAELIEKMGQVVADSKHLIHCLTIIGQVEGHYILPPQNKTTKYEHIMPALVAIEQDRSIEGLLIILNTVGGDVEAGLAIAELISGMKTPTVSVVLGGGHSIGVPLAVSADISYIVPSATMTIHPVRMNGLVLGVPQMLSYFEAMQKRITDFVCSNSKISPERFSELMMNFDLIHNRCCKVKTLEINIIFLRTLAECFGIHRTRIIYKEEDICAVIGIGNDLRISKHENPAFRDLG